MPTVEEVVAQLMAQGAVPPAGVQPPPAAAQPSSLAPPPPAPPAQPPPAVVPPNAPVTGTIAPPPQAPPAPAAISLTPEQWAAYTSSQSRIAELEAAEARRQQEAAAAEVRALQAKGQIEQAFTLQRTQLEGALTAERDKLKSIEDRAKRYALDGELARTLAAFPLVLGGPEQLTKQIREEFQVEVQGDSFAVRSKDFRSVPEYLAALLARPEYAHYLRANHPGGGTAGTQGTQSTPTGPAHTPPPPDVANLPLDQRVAAFYKANQAAIGDAAGTGGTVVTAEGEVKSLPAASFGLRRA